MAFVFVVPLVLVMGGVIGAFRAFVVAGGFRVLVMGGVIRGFVMDGVIRVFDLTKDGGPHAHPLRP